MSAPLRIGFLGSSLVSAYWNGAATYYRGIIRALADQGHHVTFFEPDAFERQKFRDIPDPAWAKVVVYPSDKDGLASALESARGMDVVIKCSGVGVFDAELEAAVLDQRRSEQLVIFWDVDAPATLDRLVNNPQDSFRPLVPRYDCILTYGGGPRAIESYKSLGARECHSIYNALDPESHFQVQPDSRFSADLALLANRMPDREIRVDHFFLDVARRLEKQKFLLGGSGWDGNGLPLNVNYVGHVFTRDHNAFNSTPRAVLNINRASMAEFGYSPPTRIFEAAGAAACVISDQWDGIEDFFEPGREILLAEDGAQVADCMADLDPERAKEIGLAARRRALAEHTYERRVAELERLLFPN